MCTALASRGHQVCLYTNESADPILTAENAAFELHQFSVEWRPYQLSLSLAKALHVNIRRFEFVHIHMLHRFPQAAAAHFARRDAVPYCVQPHGGFAPNIYFGRRKVARQAYVGLIERRDVERAAGVLHTAELEEQWIREIGLNPRKSYIVPVGADIAELSHAVDPKPFRERFNLGNRKIVLWMGRIVEMKGLRLLCEAFAQCQILDASLVMVGPDPVGHRAELESLVSKLGIRDKVVFTGFLDGESKRQALTSADIFVLPSLSENFGLAALEAMALGCPAFISPGVCIANDIAAAGAGLVIEREAASWAQVLSNLLTDSRQRTGMGIAARQFSWRYDWSNVAMELEQSYTAMLEN